MTITMSNAVTTAKNIITTKDNAMLPLLSVPTVVRDMKPLLALKQVLTALYQHVSTVRGTTVLKDMPMRQHQDSAIHTLLHRKL